LVFDVENALFTDPAKVHRIDHAGAFFKVEGPANSPRPPQGRPVIVEIDASADGLELAAATADILIIRPLTSDEAVAITGAVKAKAKALDRDLIVLADLLPVLDRPDETGAARLSALDALAPPTNGPASLTFAGAPADLAELMQAWATAGACDGFNLLPAVLPDDLETFVGAVVPELRRRGLAPADYAGLTLRDHLRLTQPVSRHSVPAHG
jgi:alkanesulfonate monooxygenase SsuD/methylene tetrahydromethanopterin reductase-like flavin-dependent oxidoreductase (luciferase family)